MTSGTIEIPSDTTDGLSQRPSAPVTNETAPETPFDMAFRVKQDIEGLLEKHEQAIAASEYELGARILRRVVELEDRQAGILQAVARTMLRDKSLAEALAYPAPILDLSPKEEKADYVATDETAPVQELAVPASDDKVTAEIPPASAAVADQPQPTKIPKPEAVVKGKKVVRPEIVHGKIVVYPVLPANYFESVAVADPKQQKLVNGACNIKHKHKEIIVIDCRDPKRPVVNGTRLPYQKQTTLLLNIIINNRGFVIPGPVIFKELGSIRNSDAKNVSKQFGKYSTLLSKFAGRPLLQRNVLSNGEFYTVPDNLLIEFPTEKTASKPMSKAKVTRAAGHVALKAKAAPLDTPKPTTQHAIEATAKSDKHNKDRPKAKAGTERPKPAEPDASELLRRNYLTFQHERKKRQHPRNRDDDFKPKPAGNAEVRRIGWRDDLYNFLGDPQAGDANLATIPNFSHRELMVAWDEARKHAAEAAFNGWQKRFFQLQSCQKYRH